MPRIIDAFAQFFDDNGGPLVNGFLAFKESGTNNTDKNTFADINETIANANPVPLDGAGRCPNVFGTGAYNAISYAEDANNPGTPGQQIQQFDPVNISAIEGQFSDWNSAVSYNLGDLVIASDDNYYRSLTNNNENQDPTVSAGQWEEVKFIGVWNINVAYDSGDSVYGSNGVLYLSLTDSNIANNPTTGTINWKSYIDNNSPNVLDNVGFTATVATKALTFDLKTRNLIDPTASDKVMAAFRSETLTAGDYDIIDVGAALDIIVPDGATLGFTAAATGFIYFYAMNVSGAVELAVSGSVLDDSVLHSSTAIDATADSVSVLYSTTGRSNVPIRQIGRIKIATGAVAGEWDNAPTELYIGDPFTHATQAEQEAGTSTSVAVSPSVQHYHPSAAKVWVAFDNTGTLTILDSYNVSSVTDIGVGIFKVNYAASFSSVNYTCFRSAKTGGDGEMGTPAAGYSGSVSNRTTSGTLIDSDYVWFVAFGDQ